MEVGQETGSQAPQGRLVGYVVQRVLAAERMAYLRDVLPWESAPRAHSNPRWLAHSHTSGGNEIPAHFQVCLDVLDRDPYYGPVGSPVRPKTTSVGRDDLGVGGGETPPLLPSSKSPYLSRRLVGGALLKQWSVRRLGASNGLDNPWTGLIDALGPTLVVDLPANDHLIGGHVDGAQLLRQLHKHLRELRRSDAYRASEVLALDFVSRHGAHGRHEAPSRGRHPQSGMILRWRRSFSRRLLRWPLNGRLRRYPARGSRDDLGATRVIERLVHGVKHHGAVGQHLHRHGASISTHARARVKFTYSPVWLCARVIRVRRDDGRLEWWPLSQNGPTYGAHSVGRHKMANQKRISPKCHSWHFGHSLSQVSYYQWMDREASSNPAWSLVCELQTALEEATGVRYDGGDKLEALAAPAPTPRRNEQTGEPWSDAELLLLDAAIRLSDVRYQDAAMILHAHRAAPAPTGAPDDLVALVREWQAASKAAFMAPGYGEQERRNDAMAAVLAWHPAAPALPEMTLRQKVDRFIVRKNDVLTAVYLSSATADEATRIENLLCAICCEFAEHLIPGWRDDDAADRA